jgi:hypothetical protein
VGLEHLSLACRGANGHFTLALDDDGWVVCSIFLPAQILDCRPLTGSLKTELISTKTQRTVKQLHGNLLPSRCKIMVIDDSKVGSPHCARLRESRNVRTHQKIPVHKVLCKGYSRILLPALNADIERSEVVCPSSEQCVDSFIAKALGKDQLKEIDCDEADIVLLDQNIELQSGTVCKHSVFFVITTPLFSHTLKLRFTWEQISRMFSGLTISKGLFSFDQRTRAKMRAPGT